MELFATPNFKPEIDLPIRLKINEPTTIKHPVLKGYIRLTRSDVELLAQLFSGPDASDSVLLSVALWDNSVSGRRPEDVNYPIGGNVTFNNFSDTLPPSSPPPSPSIWY